ncbi:MAG: dedD [Gammaproteobacteria bacterium]|jgi:cell division septation protein DedD|nr:dedD [Gammaproteobacteria bacterium]
MEKIIDKKTLQRIIGIVIIGALVMVLVPLFFNRQMVISPSSGQSDTAAKLTVPAVSDQPMAAAAPVANPEMSLPNDTHNTTHTEIQNANSLSPGNSVDASTATSTTITRAPATALDTQLQAITSNGEPQQPAPQKTAPAPTTQTTVKYVGDTVEVTPAPLTDVNANVAPSNLEESTAEITPAIAADINKKSHMASNITDNKRHVIPHVIQIKNHLTTHTTSRAKPVLKAAKEGRGSSFGNSHHAASNLSLPKKSVWVVQMGSFKNKSNAHRLVSRLKASGFKAFIHETQSSTGSIRTAVYVGPESREASAAKLSTIMSKIHMRGFIVPYKPMVF